MKDGYLIESSPSWCTVQGPEGKFVYSVNANLGLKATDPDSDVLLIGDDVRLLDYNAVDTLYRLAHSTDDIGMLSPRILGGADNPVQTDPPTDCSITYSDRYLALVCTYIKRNAIIKTGYLDERFSVGWGWDDVDYSRRMRKEGLKLGVTSKVSVKHGVNRKGSESLIRNEKGDSKAIQAQDDLNAILYFNKWGDNVK